MNILFLIVIIYYQTKYYHNINIDAKTKNKSMLLYINKTKVKYF